MPAALLALLPTLIGLIPQITTGVGQLIAWISSLRTAAQQSGEWSPDLEKAFMDALIATTTDPAWKPDPK